MSTVSVVLPSFNRTGYLARAIESVLSQSTTDLELLIADDGSAAETRDYLRGLGDRRVQILWLAHSGLPSRARNAALASASGRYVAFLDSDDVWHPMKLQRQLEAIERTAARWSFVLADRIDASGQPLAPPAAVPTPREGWVFDDLLRQRFTIPMPSVLAERTLLAEIGGFDESLPFAEWHDLALRLALAAPVALAGERLCSIRAHGEHYSADRAAALRSWIALHEKMAVRAPTPALRRVAKDLRADAALRLAGAHLAAGRRGAALRALGDSARTGWRLPRWWRGAVPRFARALVGPRVAP